jgi:hypothetical protein
MVDVEVSGCAVVDCVSVVLVLGVVDMSGDVVEGLVCVPVLVPGVVVD